MRQLECEFEAEVLAIGMHGAWPHGANKELRDHVRSCSICSDVAAVAVSFTAVRESDQPVEIPSSGLVWWRAQLRRRREAAVAAERPIIAAQWIAFVCAATLLLSWTVSSLTGMQWSQLVQSTTALFTQHALLITAMAALLLGVPAVVYFASGKER